MFLSKSRSRMYMYTRTHTHILIYVYILCTRRCVYTFIIVQIKLTNYVTQFVDCLSSPWVPGFPRFKNCLDAHTPFSGCGPTPTPSPGTFPSHVARSLAQ